MHVTRVIYTVQPSYVAHNKENVNRVMDELRSSGRNDIRYSSYLEDDGKTFMHLVVKKDADTPGIATAEAFKIFLNELNASEPEKKPVTTQMELVGAMFDII